MRLREINESLLSQLIRQRLRNGGINNNPGNYITDALYNPSSGLDSGANATQAGGFGGFVTTPLGIPWKPRHRSFLGMANRGFALRPPS